MTFKAHLKRPAGRHEIFTQAPAESMHCTSIQKHMLISAVVSHGSGQCVVSSDAAVANWIQLSHAWPESDRNLGKSD